jgi:hypothetical protein
MAACSYLSGFKFAADVISDASHAQSKARATTVELCVEPAVKHVSAICRPPQDFEACI